MDLRKVQLTGGSSLTVTLPKAWVAKALLRPGDVVGCVEQPDGSLAIHTRHEKDGRATQRYVIEHAGSDESYLFRKIIAAYLMGYDAIAVTSKKPLPPSARAAVRQAVKRIMGLEVTEEEPNAIGIQDFLDSREFHMGKALRRMSLLTQAMQDEAFAVLKDPDKALLASVEDRDDEVDRLYWLVNKHYHAMLRDSSYATGMGLTLSQALNLLLVARLVERSADHASRIATQAFALKDARLPEAFIARLERQAQGSAALFREAIQVFHKQDAKRANAIIDEVSTFLRSQERVLKEAYAHGGETVAHLAFIVESIGRTAAYAADVSEIAINHKVATATGGAP